MKWLVLLIVPVLLLTGCGCKRKDNDNIRLEEYNNSEKANVRENIIKEQEINGLRFSNIALIFEDGNSTFSVEITNLTDNNIEVNSIKLLFKDRDGKKIVEIPGYVGNTLEPKTSTIMISSSNIDLRGASSVEYIF